MTEEQYRAYLEKQIARGPFDEIKPGQDKLFNKIQIIELLLITTAANTPHNEFGQAWIENFRNLFMKYNAYNVLSAHRGKDVFWKSEGKKIAEQIITRLSIPHQWQQADCNTTLTV